MEGDRLKAVCICVGITCEVDIRMFVSLLATLCQLIPRTDSALCRAPIMFLS